MSLKFLNDISLESESFDVVLQKIKNSAGGLILSLNPETFYLTQTQPFFKNLFQNALINLPDGMGIVKAVAWLTDQKIKRMPGVELIETLFKNDPGPYFFLGAKQAVLQQLAQTMKNQYQIQISGMQDGYFALDQESQILERIKNLKPRFVLIAMGSPRQEELAFKLQSLCQQTFIIPCGGSLDVISGVISRAPLIFRQMHLEWLHRLITQPFRIRRALPKLIWFVFFILKKKLRITS
jgi:exopolysaccharide biosynthesis WecB/TagA/CpsF family protein